MPAYRSRTILEIGLNLRAFLNLEAGLTRGAVPDSERELRRLRERTKRQAEELATLRGRPGGGRRAAARLSSELLARDGSYGPLKVVHVALDDGPSGAGRAASKLHAALRRLGHDSSMFVAGRRGEDPCVRAFEPREDAASRAERAASKGRDLARYEASRPKHLIGDGFTDDRSANGAEPLKQLPPADVANLHWFGGFLDYRALFSTVSQNTPIVWTLHDMNAFTGGCHYDDGCGKFSYTPGCGACPQLGSANERDLSRETWLRKHEALAGLGGNDLRLVAVSRWLAAQARRSPLLEGFPLTTIHPSIDSQIFAPRDREAARDALGVPRNARVVLFVADSLVTRRKGFALLAEALEGLERVPGLFLLSLGHHAPGSVASIPHVNLGFVEDDRLLSGIYSAADVFVMPSVQEAFGQTVLEAMACGTPTIGFDVGGVPEMVRPGVTGELAPPGDVAALRGALEGLLRDPERRAELSEAGRRVAVEEFSHDVAAGRYAELYRSMLAARRTG